MPQHGLGAEIAGRGILMPFQIFILRPALIADR
jgi:hypothetical protein